MSGNNNIDLPKIWLISDILLDVASSAVYCAIIWSPVLRIDLKANYGGSESDILPLDKVDFLNFKRILTKTPPKDPKCTRKPQL